MSDETARLKLAQLVSLQELNAVTWNEALAQLDALVDLYLLGQFVNDPPSSPQDGDAYLIGGAPTGAWNGYAYKIASCRDGAWRFCVPFNGLRAFVAATSTVVVYRNGVWSAVGSTDFATKSGAETLTNKTFAGAVAFPGGGGIDASGNVGVGIAPSSDAELCVVKNVRVGDTLLPIAHSAKGNIYAFNASGACGMYAGQDATHMLGFYWSYNADNTAAYALLFTYGYANDFRIGGKNVALLPHGGGLVGVNTSSPLDMLDVNGNIVPHVDNAFNLGSASLRMATIFAATGAINTSGAAAKENIRVFSAAEIEVAKTLAANIRIYQFCDAVARKGADAARLHTGMIYEDVIAAFAAQGLDPLRYGVVCRDPACVVASTVQTVTDHDGSAVERNQETCVPDRDAAGSQKWILGLRYDELAQFVLAGLAARISVLEAR